MKAELTLVANASEAHLFSRASRRDPLLPVAMLKHEASRARGTELGSDRAGHGSSDRRPGGVAFEPRMDRRRKQHLQFANEIARRIDDELGSGRYDSVVLFASCPFIGELKSRLSPAAQRSLSAAIELDLTSFAVDELEHRVDEALHQHASLH